MARILLTGANGFLGRHCVHRLARRGHEVHAVSSKALDANQRSAPQVRWHRADLLDAAQTATLLSRVKPTHLLHLAWYTVPGKYWTATENFSWVEASFSLLQSFAEHGGKRVVMAGTCAEYDWTGGLCSELTTPLTPTTVYGACKHALQLRLDAFALQTGLSAAWGRIFFLYGPHENPKRFVASIICSLLENQTPSCAAPSQRRDFLFIEDAAAAFVALLESDVRGPVNIASGHAVELRQVISEIEDKLQRSHVIDLDVKRRTPDDPPLLVGDVNRLQKEVDWIPHFDLAQGLSLTIDWWKRFEPKK
jgi:nucleoside-diphosphate-sugar epimerase